MILQENLEKEDQILVSLAGLKQVCLFDLTLRATGHSGARQAGHAVAQHTVAWAEPILTPQLLTPLAPISDSV